MRQAPRLISLLGVLLAMATAPVLAQEVPTNPTIMEFESADHNTLMPDGTTPKVTGYRVSWYLGGATSPTTVVEIGKPVPVGTQNGRPLIRVTISDYIRPLGDGRYIARVAAWGPPGVSEDAASNPFDVAGVARAVQNVVIRFAS